MPDNIELLMDRWIGDTEFRAAMRRDPEGAVRDAGVSLTTEEQEALKAIDWSLSDDELTARVSKHKLIGC